MRAYFASHALLAPRLMRLDRTLSAIIIINVQSALICACLYIIRMLCHVGYASGGVASSHLYVPLLRSRGCGGRHARTVQRPFD